MVMDRVFRFHCIAREWRECTFAEMVDLHMRNLSIGLVRTPKSGLPAPALEQVYCTRHRAFEKLEKFDGYIASTDAGCTLECCAIPSVKLQNTRSYCIPMYWRVRQENPRFDVEVSVRLAEIADGVEIVDWLCVVFPCGFHEHGNAVEDELLSQTDCNDKVNDIMPDVGTDAIVDGMRESAVFIYGFKPSTLRRMHGFSKIEAFLRRPLDLNIVFLEKFIGEDFDKLFPVDATDNFKPLCEYLGIQPSKSLRKAYTYNPYAVIWNMLLRQFGVHDVNLIQRFYGYDSCFSHFFLSKFVFFKEYGLVGRLNEDEAYRWKCVEFYFRWIISQKGQKVFVHRLLKMTQNGVSNGEHTAIEKFYAYYRSLSISVKDEILEHGMTDYIQQVIENEIDRIEETGMTFHYSAEEVAYEDFIAGFAFRLVADTEELYEIGRVMSNCVGDYREDIVCGESLVMTVSSDVNYYACLEIQDGAIVQAKGPYNEQLSDGICRIVCYWSIKHNLKVETEDIDMFEEYLQEMQNASKLSRMLA